MPVPPASSPEALRRMQRQRQRDTKPERALRGELHRRGLRYRIHRRVLPTSGRRADIVFGPSKVAVFVDGCYWHQCPQHGTAPRANAAWWAEKLRRNVERDRETDRLLEEAGWLPIHVWEHEDMACAGEAIRQAVAARRPSAPPVKSR